MDSKSILIITLIISLTLVIYDRKLEVNAQDIKGGSSFSSSSSSSLTSTGGLKGSGGGGFSRFRESISSFQQKQAQAIAQNDVTRTVSSSTFVQRPARVEQTVKQTVVEETSSQQQTSSDSEPTIYGSIEGVPGVDFPGYTTIPNTKFSCSRLPYDPGMYADETTGCQVYHLCYQGRRESFLCGIGTIFNQAIMNCDFWHAADCSKSSQYYHLNAEFGKSSSEPGTQSNWAKQEAKSVVTKIAVPPPPRSTVVSEKTNFFSDQRFVSNDIPPPVVNTNFNRRIESTSFSSTGKISPPKVSSSFGKTSSRTEQSRVSSGGLISPARHGFSRSTVHESTDYRGNGVQFASESSNRFSKTSMPVVGTSLTVTQADGSSGGELTSSVGRKFNSKASKSTSSSSESSKTQKESSYSSSKVSSLTRPPVSFKGHQGSANEVPTSSGDSQNEWKPYFKSKATTTTTTTKTTQPPSPETTASPSTLALPDQEPTFSDNRASTESSGSENKVKTGMEDDSTTTAKLTETPNVPNTGIESDIGSAVSVTSPSPESESSSSNEVSLPSTEPPSTTTTKSKPPPTPETEQPATTTTSSPASSSAEITQTVSPTTTRAADTTTTPPPTTTTSSVPEPDKMPTTVEVNTTTSNSSVEYATEPPTTEPEGQGESGGDGKRKRSNNNNDNGKKKSRN